VQNKKLRKEGFIFCVELCAPSFEHVDICISTPHKIIVSFPRWTLKLLCFVVTQLPISPKVMTPNFQVVVHGFFLVMDLIEKLYYDNI
jgi:hypothetical protein